MPVPIPAGLRLGIIEPKSAIEVFQQRALLKPTFLWEDLFQEEHARGFAVAGVMRDDVLQLFYDTLQKSIAAGESLAQFRKAIRPALVAKGMWGDIEITDPATGEVRTTRFDNRRLQLIYETNVRQSHAAGRWAAIEAGKAELTLVMYRTMDDDLVRPEHKAWHNLVLPVDHPFWRTHFPPNGWRCRCHAFAIDEAGVAELAAAGQKIQREAPPEQVVPFFNRSTGRVVAVPRGIDPGFAYNPGQVHMRGVVPQRAAPGAFLATPAAEAPAALGALPAARTVPASMVLPSGTDAGLAAQLFLQEFDAVDKPAEFVDRAGHTLVISEELFRLPDGRWSITGGAERIVQLLAEALQDPDEIWAAPVRQADTGREVLRRRYLVRLVVDGIDRPVVVVFELDGRTWSASSSLGRPDDAEGLLAQARNGSLVYSR
jgi:SPP1 gp7 family putative phage head morphogenesis protein